MNIGNLKIGQKLWLGFGINIIFMLSISAASYIGISQLSKDLAITHNDRYPKTVLLHKIKDNLNTSARDMRNILLLKDATALKSEFDSIEKSAKIIAESISVLDKSITSEEGRKELNDLLDIRDKFVTSREKFTSLAKEGKIEEAQFLLLNETRELNLKYFDSINKLIEFQARLMTDSENESETLTHRLEILIVGMSVVAIVVVTLIALLVTKNITRPISEAVNTARLVATGDLTTVVDVRSKDEIGLLMQALKEMNSSLAKIVGQVRIGTDTIATASSQIAAGNLDLSSRTEEQASSLEETASSMEELTSTVKQNADNARQANILAEFASNVALKGGNVVSQVVNTMDNINTSARKIVDIIGVIDGIAFQTNILALNAAVEAARAGEQGRGFAVVASEVRTLAQRSASAAKEIKTLIDESVNAVEIGTSLVDEAGRTMTEIVISVRRATDVISEISAASQEQTSGIEQINIAITQMDEVTQQNASLVEEAAAAAESMQDQARILAETVAFFKVNNSTTATGIVLSKRADRLNH